MSESEAVSSLPLSCWDLGVRGGTCVNSRHRLFSVEPLAWAVGVCAEFTEDLRVVAPLAAPPRALVAIVGTLAELRSHPMCTGSGMEAADCPSQGGSHGRVLREWEPTPLPSPGAPDGGWGWGGGVCYSIWAFLALTWIFLTWMCFCSYDILSCHHLLKREKGRAWEEMGYSLSS